MAAIHSDALVFFGATGDLAHKKIFPALQSMVARGRFDVPVIGLKTIEVMRQAGATCLALDAGKCLLLDGSAIIVAADAAGITIVAD